MGQAITTFRFFTYGRQHFTQTGWTPPQPERVVSGCFQRQAVAQLRKAHAASYGYGQDLQSINLRGKVSVVTGANSGRALNLSSQHVLGSYGLLEGSPHGGLTV